MCEYINSKPTGMVRIVDYVFADIARCGLSIEI
jgi:hypothetical protein